MDTGADFRAEEIKEPLDTKIAYIVGLQLQRPHEVPIEQAKKEWKKAILDEMKRQGKKMSPSAPFITITMPCGQEIKYKTWEDIPDEDVPCPCGDKKHFFVRHVFFPKSGKN